ncbi:MAG TPA: TolC family protein [Cytophagaceae bacterium]|jgi:outer membrane protein|nr:TolC family protein [Cytophagaceae bacterium]
MNRSILFLFFVLISSYGYSQKDSAYTLQQCISYALQNQTNVKNAQVDYQSALERVGEIRAIGLPQVSGAVSIVDNPKLKNFFYQNNPAGGIVPFDPTKSVGEVIARPNFFQLRSSADANATVSQLLFDGSYVVAISSSSTYKELAKKNIVQTKTQAVEGVTKAYYMVLINQERLKLLDVNLSRLDSTLYQTRAMNQAGLAEKIDVDRLEVSYNNLITEKLKSENMMEVSKLLLQFQMNMPLEQNISLADNLNSIKIDSVAPPMGAIDPAQRIEYSILETQKKLQTFDKKNINAGYIPRLTAFGTAGLFRQDKSIGQLFVNKYYSYNMYGFNLSVPIFDGMSKHYKVQQAKLSIVKTENNIEQLKKSIDLQGRQAHINYKNSLQTLTTQKRNMDLAAEVVRVTKIKYQAGIGSNLEVVNAEASQKEAQTNYFSALYDAIVAKIDLQKASGTLYTE